jgi:hypothetical protein
MINFERAEKVLLALLPFLKACPLIIKGEIQRDYVISLNPSRIKNGTGLYERGNLLIFPFFKWENHLIQYSDYGKNITFS